MSSEGGQKLTVTVLGATGGCSLAFLVRALQAGHNCSALVRTPSKLTDMLKENEISSELISKHLTIVQGNSKDSVKVTEALKVNNVVADMILSGVGGVPVFKPNPLRPTLDDPTICQDTVSTILKALRDLHSDPASSSYSSSSSSPSQQDKQNKEEEKKKKKKKPTLVVISTTGISDSGRDIPLAMIPLYHWSLPIPHKDKKMMEKLLVEEIAKGNGDDASPAAIENFVAVRPSLLTNGRSALGFGQAIRAGIDRRQEGGGGKVDNSAIGYTISRADVGGWIFEELVEDKAGKKSTYLNQFVAITS